MLETKSISKTIKSPVKSCLVVKTRVNVAGRITFLEMRAELKTVTATVGLSVKFRLVCARNGLCQ